MVLHKEIYYTTGSCRNCEYSTYNIEAMGVVWWCIRFPAWIKIKDADSHWCGEWKAEVQNG